MAAIFETGSSRTPGMRVRRVDIWKDHRDILSGLMAMFHGVGRQAVASADAEAAAEVLKTGEQRMTAGNANKYF